MIPWRRNKTNGVMALLVTALVLLLARLMLTIWSSPLVLVTYFGYMTWAIYRQLSLKGLSKWRRVGSAFEYEVYKDDS